MPVSSAMTESALSSRSRPCSSSSSSGSGAARGTPSAWPLSWRSMASTMSVRAAGSASPARSAIAASTRAPCSAARSLSTRSRTRRSAVARSRSATRSNVAEHLGARRRDRGDPLVDLLAALLVEVTAIVEHRAAVAIGAFALLDERLGGLHRLLARPAPPRAPPRAPPGPGCAPRRPGDRPPPAPAPRPPGRWRRRAVPGTAGGPARGKDRADADGGDDDDGDGQDDDHRRECTRQARRAGRVAASASRRRVERVADLVDQLAREEERGGRQRAPPVPAPAPWSARSAGRAAG